MYVSKTLYNSFQFRLPTFEAGLRIFSPTMSSVKFHCDTCHTDHTGVVDRFSDFRRLGLVGPGKTVVLLRSSCTKNPFNSSILVNEADLTPDT